MGTGPGPCSPGAGRDPAKWTEEPQAERQGGNREPPRVAGLSRGLAVLRGCSSATAWAGPFPSLPACTRCWWGSVPSRKRLGLTGAWAAVPSCTHRVRRRVPLWAPPGPVPGTHPVSGP